MLRKPFLTQKTGPASFAGPVFRLRPPSLIHYDREKSAELYQTLRVFTKCGFNKAHTSERLFLHRNTVNYRIAQIESICGIDLSTTELLFSLQLSFLIESSSA